MWNKPRIGDSGMELAWSEARHVNVVERVIA
jgi:hypothetical protein